MPPQNKRILNIIDKAVLFFFVLFLLTLTNSIFLNQIGYYSTILLIIARGFLLKENPFSKSGLEVAFIWFILSELLSLIFSAAPAEALLFMLKRILLLPIVYTSAAASFDFSKAKLYVKIYLGASIASILVYLYFSLKYVIYDLYSVTGSGPSIFQYPITVSEITSFTVVILFAFLINERLSTKNKIYLFIGFTLSVLALLSTYKRTGWMGAAIGLAMILILKKKWSILVPALMILIALLIYDENVSEVSHYELQNRNLVQKNMVNTPGRATDIYIEDTSVYISDYENGLVKFGEENISQVIKFDGPVISVKNWNDSFFVASLVDTRFILLRKQGEKFVIENEFLTPGFTNSYQAANGKLYVNDKDSGLSIFNSPGDIKSPVRYSSIKGYSGLLVDSGKIIFYSFDTGVDVYSLSEGYPVKKTDSLSFEKLSAAALYNNSIVISGSSAIKIYSSDSTGIALTDSSALIKNAFRIVESGGMLYVLTSQRELFEAEVIEHKINILSVNRIDFTPLSFNIEGNNVYFTKVKRSRLLSFFDPYLPSNMNRIALWNAGWRIFKDHSVFGVGDVDLAGYFRKYKNDYDKDIQGHLHNNFIHILATLGLFGLLAVCFLFYKYLQLSFRIYSRNKLIPFAGSFALGVIGCFSAFLVSGLTELNFWDHEIASLIWFLFGINTAFYYLNTSITKSDG